MTGSADEIPLPPVEFVHAVGGSDYKATGKHFVDLFTGQCGLQKGARVLDVGSGCGRLAVPLTSYLLPSARYEGIDIVKPMVDWCTNNITPRFPNFRFQHADLTNTLYSQGGSRASGYRFPFDSGTFDFVYLTSVFTHLDPDDTKNYLAEISRVLAPKGRTFMTFYLHNDEYVTNRTSDKALVTLDHGSHPYYVNDPTYPKRSRATMRLISWAWSEASICRSTRFPTGVGTATAAGHFRTSSWPHDAETGALQRRNDTREAWSRSRRAGSRFGVSSCLIPQKRPRAWRLPDVHYNGEFALRTGLATFQAGFSWDNGFGYWPNADQTDRDSKDYGLTCVATHHVSRVPGRDVPDAELSSMRANKWFGLLDEWVISRPS